MRGVARGAAVVLLVVAGLFGWVFHERYWRWRGCFNDQGRCWDEASEQVFVEGAGVVWGGMALIPLVLAILLLVLSRRSQP